MLSSRKNSFSKLSQKSYKIAFYRALILVKNVFSEICSNNCIWTKISSPLVYLRKNKIQKTFAFFCSPLSLSIPPLSLFLPIFLSIFLSILLSIFLSIFLYYISLTFFLYLSLSLSIYLSFFITSLSHSFSISLFVKLSFFDTCTHVDLNNRHKVVSVNTNQIDLCDVAVFFFIKYLS